MKERLVEEGMGFIIQRLVTGCREDKTMMMEEKPNQLFPGPRPLVRAWTSGLACSPRTRHTSTVYDQVHTISIIIMVAKLYLEYWAQG